LWFANSTNNSIGRITTAGAVTNFADPTMKAPYGITPGSDGALWFTNDASIGRITTGGAVTNYFASGLKFISGIASGPDGALWFTIYHYPNATIGRITTAGQITKYPEVPKSGPRDIARGPDGAMWFVNNGTNAIGRITTTVTPAITGFNPVLGPVGTKVTISGINLGGATQVYVHGVAATILSNTPTKIKIKVPIGATTGRVSVVTPAGRATSVGDFTVT
jgi:streptogramin lyase